MRKALYVVFFSLFLLILLSGCTGLGEAFKIKQELFGGGTQPEPTCNNNGSCETGEMPFFCPFDCGTKTIPDMVPHPKKAFLKDYSVSLDSSWKIRSSDCYLLDLMNDLNEAIKGELGIECLHGEQPFESKTIVLAKIYQSMNLINQKNIPLFYDLGKEGYILDISNDQILVLGNSRQGIINGVHTLMALLELSPQLEAQLIIDWPDKEIRGVNPAALIQLDWHWIPMEAHEEWIKKFAKYKINLANLLTYNFYGLTFNLFGLSIEDPDLAAINLKKYKKLFESRGIKFVPIFLNLGYGFRIVSLCPECSEGIFVEDEPFSFPDGINALPVNPIYFEVPNNSFELVDPSNPSLPEHWSIIPASGREQLDWSLYINPSGQKSMKLSISKENAPAQRSAKLSNVNNRIEILPNSVYYWTVNASGNTLLGKHLISAHIQDENGNILKGDTIYFPAGSFDWRKFDSFFFTGENARFVSFESVALSAASGDLLIDDITLMRLNGALQNVIHTNLTALKVTNLDKTVTFQEGVDYSVSYAETVYPFQPPIESTLIQRIPSGSIGENETVLVSYDLGGVWLGANSSNISYSTTEPRTWSKVIDPAIDLTLNAVSPKFVHITHDEVRGFNRDSRAKARNLSNAEMLAENINKIYSKVKAVSPETKLIAWSDMLNPFHNGGDPLYEARYAGIAGETFPAVDLIPKDLIIALWWLDPTENIGAPDFFKGKGFNYFLSGAEGGENAGETLNFWAQEKCSKEEPKCLGIHMSFWASFDENLLKQTAELGWNAPSNSGLNCSTSADCLNFAECRKPECLPCESGNCETTYSNICSCNAGICIQTQFPANPSMKCDGTTCIGECDLNTECNDNSNLTQDICSLAGTCNSTCSNPPCNAVCSSDFDCVDLNWAGENTCVFSGTCDAYCKELPCEVECTSSKDCGQDQECVFTGFCSSYCRAKPMLSGMIECYSDLDCDDLNFSTFDYCVNEGTPYSYCKNVSYEIACFNHLDCFDKNTATLDYCINLNTEQAHCIHTTVKPSCASDEQCFQGHGGLTLTYSEGESIELTRDPGHRIEVGQGRTVEGVDKVRLTLYSGNTVIDSKLFPVGRVVFSNLVFPLKTQIFISKINKQTIADTTVYSPEITLYNQGDYTADKCINPAEETAYCQPCFEGCLADQDCADENPFTIDSCVSMQDCGSFCTHELNNVVYSKDFSSSPNSLEFNETVTFSELPVLNSNERLEETLSLEADTRFNSSPSIKDIVTEINEGGLQYNLNLFNPLQCGYLFDSLNPETIPWLGKEKEVEGVECKSEAVVSVQQPFYQQFLEGNYVYDLNGSDGNQYYLYILEIGQAGYKYLAPQFYKSDGTWVENSIFYEGDEIVLHKYVGGEIIHFNPQLFVYSINFVGWGSPQNSVVLKSFALPSFQQSIVPGDKITDLNGFDGNHYFIEIDSIKRDIEGAKRVYSTLYYADGTPVQVSVQSQPTEGEEFDFIDGNYNPILSSVVFVESIDFSNRVYLNDPANKPGSYAQGNQINGLAGVNGEEYYLLVGGGQGSGEKTTIQMTLFNSSDGIQVASGWFSKGRLQFFDSQGNELLKTNLFIRDITQQERFPGGIYYYARIVSGNQLIELRDGKGYPFELGAQAGDYSWIASLGVSNNEVHFIAIKNFNSFVGENALRAGDFISFPISNVRAKFLGLQLEDFPESSINIPTTDVVIGNGQLRFTTSGTSGNFIEGDTIQGIEGKNSGFYYTVVDEIKKGVGGSNEVKLSLFNENGALLSQGNFKAGDIAFSELVEPSILINEVIAGSNAYAVISLEYLHSIPFYLSTKRNKVKDGAEGTFNVDGKTVWWKISLKKPRIFGTKSGSTADGTITFKKNNSRGELINTVEFVDGEVVSEPIEFKGNGGMPVGFKLLVDVSKNKMFWLFLNQQTFNTKYGGKIRFIGTDKTEDKQVDWTMFVPKSIYLPEGLGGGSNFDPNNYFIAHFSLSQSMVWWWEANNYIDTSTGNLISLPNPNLSSYGAQITVSNNLILRNDDPTQFIDSAYMDGGSKIWIENQAMHARIPENGAKAEILVYAEQ